LLLLTRNFFLYRSTCTKQGMSAAMQLSVRVFDCVSFYDFYVRFRNCSNSMVFFVCHIIDALNNIWIFILHNYLFIFYVLVCLWLYWITQIHVIYCTLSNKVFEFESRYRYLLEGITLPIVWFIRYYLIMNDNKKSMGL
jgi:hypothetical protein